MSWLVGGCGCGLRRGRKGAKGKAVVGADGWTRGFGFDGELGLWADGVVGWVGRCMCACLGECMVKWTINSSSK